MERLRHLVVVVPGIGGSVLAARDEAVAWGKGRGPLVSAVVSPERLSLGEHPDLVPVGLAPKTRLVGWTVIHGYDGLVRKIAGGFANARVETARQGTEPSGRADVVLFPYDFRLPVRESAERLAAEVGARLAALPADVRARRVIVVAHSMGGLVARYWLGPLGGAECCRALITVGTPHSGAPQAIDWLINGVRAGPRVLERATAVLRGWQSSYDLLPCYRAVLAVNGAQVPAGTAADPGAGSAGEPVYPDELGDLLADEQVGGWFTVPARQGLDMHREIESAWAALPGSGREPEVVPLFGRGHATLNRAVVQDGRLVVTKQDAEWRPNRGWRGDGTVPAADSIPVELDDRRGGWQAMTDRHQQMAAASRIVDILRNLSGESIAVRGAEQPDRPWLGLDLDELVPASQPITIAAQLLGADPDSPSGVWVSATPAGQPASRMRHRMDYAGGWWRARLPAPSPGVYRVMVEAVGVPGVDRLACSDEVGVVAE